MLWQDVLAADKNAAYFQRLLSFIAEQKAQGKVIYPPQAQIFSAFEATELADVKVVILGQDPYHGAGQAHGLCFSVPPGIKVPPSLKNIYKELSSDIPGFKVPEHGCLTSWAAQGVFLLNTVLTVEAGKAHSHAKSGWETFTDAVIEKINQHKTGVVFMLWGAHAQKKGAAIDTKRHLVLQAPHPSPLSAHRGFLGCQHFSQANQYLQKQGVKPIDWSSICQPA
ncbi:uracil-DNA glycosylase [Gayadomonas joobiniege]|uniref:uracil-DNA glycosylase n=1 Tax=Gayadomonas joobiniege TaxID=1234606 RepID=UPI000363CAFB|nr:uracil-DNA glycosylase [Gayadomonas joobiniege]